MRKPIHSLVVLLLFIAFVSACGQKGPLFLPGDPSSLQSIPPAGELQELPEDEDEDDEDESNPVPIQN